MEYVLALLLAAPQEEREDFESRLSLNVIYDGWEQVADNAHPPYNEVYVVRDPEGARSGTHYARLRTLGGNTAFRMLPRKAWKADPSRSYRLGASVRLSGHRSNSAYLTLRWFDRDLNLLREDRSRTVPRAPEWTPLALSVPRPPAEAAWAAPGLHFDGRDVRGECAFDLVTFAGKTRLEVRPAGRKLPLFPPDTVPSFAIEIPGLPDGEHDLELVSRDPEGRVAGRAGPARISASRGVALSLPRHPPGFFEVEVSVGALLKDSFPLVIHEPREAPPAPLFGATFNPWTTEYDGIADLAELAGARDVKITVRGSGARAPAPQEIARLLRDAQRIDPASVAAVVAAETDLEDLRALARAHREHVTHWEIGGRGLAEATRALHEINRFWKVGPLEPPADPPSLADLVRLAASGARPSLPLEAGGLLDEEGRPTAALLAAARANELLSGAVYEKEARLLAPPVREHVFRQGARAVVALWSEAGEVERELFLGSSAEIVPAVGSPRPLARGRRLRVGPAPLFIRGVEIETVRLLQGLELHGGALPLRLDPSVRHLRLRNPFLDTALRGVRIELEGSIPLPPLEAREIPPGAEFSWPVRFLLPRSAREGRLELTLRLTCSRGGEALALATSRSLDVTPLLGIEVASGERTVRVQVANRAGRPAQVVTRVRLPGAPERIDRAVLAPGGVRELEVPAGDAREVEVLCEEAGGERLHARRTVPLRK